MTNTENKTEVKASSNQTMSNARDQLTKLSSTVQDFLSNMNAQVETTRFVIEKAENGTRIDFEFKATIGLESKTKTTS